MYKYTSQRRFVLSKQDSYAEGADVADHSITGQELNHLTTNVPLKWTESMMKKGTKNLIEIFALFLRGLRDIYLGNCGEASITLGLFDFATKRKEADALDQEASITFGLFDFATKGKEADALDRRKHSVSGQFAEILRFLEHCNLTSLFSAVIAVTSVLPESFDANHLFRALFLEKYQRVRPPKEALQILISNTLSYESALEVLEVLLNRPLVMTLLDKSQLTADQSEVSSRRKASTASHELCLESVDGNFVKNQREEVSFALRRIGSLCSILDEIDADGILTNIQLEQFTKNCIIFRNFSEPIQYLSCIGDSAIIVMEAFETEQEACTQCNKTHFMFVVAWVMILNGLVSVTDSLAKYLALGKSLGSHMSTQRKAKYLQDIEKLLQGKEDFHDLHSRTDQQESNEEPFQRPDEWMSSQKNDLNSRSEGEEATMEGVQFQGDHWDPKGRHPSGEWLGRQREPERIGETSHVCDIMDQKQLTILDQQGYEIPLHSSSKLHPSPSPPPRPSEDSLPVDTRIHSNDLSARLGEKSCGSLPPAAPETTADRTGQQAEDKHQETEDSAADSRSLPAPMTEIPEANPPQDRLLYNEGPLEGLSLRYNSEKLHVESGYQTKQHGASPVQNTPTEVGSSMGTQNEESSALEVPVSSEESPIALRSKVLTENESEDRGQRSENDTPEPPRQSVARELTTGYEMLPAKGEILPADLTLTDSNFEPLPQQSEAQETPEGGVYSLDKQEIFLEELHRAIDVTTRAHLPEMNAPPRPGPGDEDYVSLAESKGNFPPQSSRVDIDEPSRLGTVAEPFLSVKAHKKLELERGGNSVESSSKGICFDRDSQSAVDHQRIAASEPLGTEEESVTTDQTRDPVVLAQLQQENGIIFIFRPLLSSWEFFRERLQSITIRPFFPDSLNGTIEFDFRNPMRASMHIEGFRLCTFLHCPSAEALPALRLANAGFYYTGRDGVVACYSCDLRCRPDDARLQGDPYAFHLEMSRHCPHINNANQDHLFIQNHQTSARSGRDITGSPSEGTQEEQVGVQETAARSKQAIDQANIDFQQKIEALNNVSRGTRATGRAALRGAGSEHEPQNAAVDVSAHGTTSASASTGGGSPSGLRSVSSLHQSGESAESAQTVSTPIITNTANDTARQDSPASQHPAGVEATTHTTGQTASSAASHQISNTSLPNPGRGLLATGGTDTGNSNRSASHETAERNSGDVTSSSGDVTREDPRTERPPQENLESRQTSSRPVNAAASNVLTNGQRAVVPTRGIDESVAGNDSRTLRPRMGLLGGSSDHGLVAAVNGRPAVANNTTHGGEAPPQERPPQEHLGSRQTSSRPVNTAGPSVLTNGQRTYASTRGNGEPITGVHSRPRMGLLGGSSAHEALVFSTVNGRPSVATNTTHGGEAPPQPRQAETVPPSDAVRPAPSVPAFDPSGAVHMRYAARETREHSFLGRWPDTHAQSPEELAHAGFFCAGTEDCVRCHYCGLGLRHWEPEDRPIEEHVRWRSSCGYLRHLLGEDAITRTLARIGPLPNGPTGQSAPGRASTRTARGSVANGNRHQTTSPDLQADTERFMRSEVVTPAREMGFSDDSIRRGIEALLQTSAGRRAVTGQNLVHTILFLRDRGRDLDSPTPSNAYGVDVSSDESDDDTAPLPTNGSQANHTANAREVFSARGPAGHAAFPPRRDAIVGFALGQQNGSDGDISQYAMSDRVSPNTSQRPLSPAHAEASLNGQAGPETIRQLEAENQELLERRRCKICLDNDISILFLPCGHLVCCAECAPALRRCPICRKRVSGTVSIQFAGMPSGQQL